MVESRSFVAAASKLGMSKSLVIRHVCELEDSLAVKLLKRTTRRLSLTEAGAVFYEHCARIVQEAKFAEQRLSETQAEPAGLVKVTAAAVFAVRHVLPALTNFYKTYPKIRVQLLCSNRLLELGESNDANAYNGGNGVTIAGCDSAEVLSGTLNYGGTHKGR